MSTCSALTRLFSGLMWVCAAACLFFSSAGFADERILDYHSDLQIHTNGGLLVTETIRVRVEGNKIRRGIYRDFPTRYTDRLGNRYRVDFKLLDVYRNGSPEVFRSENHANGIRIYIGNAERLLAHGEHEYRLRFNTDRQLGFREGFDELYWNVTGNGWIFPIDKASARINLPAAVQENELHSDFYTGGLGSTKKQAESRIVSGTAIEFQTTGGLLPNEGLTVAVSWPKGLVQEPTAGKRLSYFMQDNGAGLVLLIGILVPLGWYLWAWNRYGRDPRKGIIIPRFKPPKGLTPAGCSYIHKMSFSRRTFSAAVISLGVKGCLEIHEDSDGFIVRSKKQLAGDVPSKGENAVLADLFESDTTEVELNNENHEVFTKARSGLNKTLKNEHLGRVFNLNLVYALPALAINLVTVVVAVNLTAGFAIWIMFAILTVIMHLVFLLLLRAPTPAGRLVMDEIEGFKMYLDTAEQDRLDRMQSPEMTPEVFEMFLPFAFALGVENHWCDNFASKFPPEVEPGGNYHPRWYVGQYAGLDAVNHIGNKFTQSFATAIAAASSPPGSSSGSGGGGFSGGGGGGGGGGGW